MQVRLSCRRKMPNIAGSNIEGDFGELSGMVFAAGGPISRSLAGFEERPEQIQMADAVHKALVRGRHLVVEAGTGVGKSFAYLVPAIALVQRARMCPHTSVGDGHRCGNANGGGAGKPPATTSGKGEPATSGGKVLISTYTITLQEQLINKDIPFLSDCMSGRFTTLESPQAQNNAQKRTSETGFTAVLAKGRGNYLCKRRLEFALRGQRRLFDESGSRFSAIERISEWASQTEDGSLSDIPFVPEASVWGAVNSEHGNCRGRKCPHFRDCFYRRARRRLENADIIVANHALMFSDLVLKEQKASVLPNYRYVIADEAHNIEHVAEEHFGIRISNHRIKFLLDGLYNPRTHRGLLAYVNANKAIDVVGEIAKAARVFFGQIRDWFEQTKDETNGRCYKNFVDDRISGPLKGLRLELAKLAKQTKDVDEKFEVMRFMDRCTLLVQDLDCFMMQKKSDCVYWVEVAGRRKMGVRLIGAPINVGPDVKRCLFDEYESVILTSATLSSGPSSSRGAGARNMQEARRDAKLGFEFLTRRIGLDDFGAVKLGSPFDYLKQVTLYIERELPDPNKPAFIEAAAEAVKKYVLKTAGRAFVLFTSYAMLEEIVGRLSDWMAENDIVLHQQGAGIDRTALLERFKTTSRSCLFGTDSFWQGVDVPGADLANVIIVRLPFAVPDKPLLAGRLEQITEKGGNPFYDYQLPLAIIKFKQGFGRLIRSKTDTGIVVILDSRVVNKSYGAKFLAAIPKCKMEIVGAKKREAKNAQANG